MKNTKKVKAYFTVEAALILPMALGAIVLIMYLWFFQYNRCLLEQDAGILALRGAVTEAADNQKRITLLTEQAEQMDKDKYVAWEDAKTSITIKQGKIQVKKEGLLRFPFQGLIPGKSKCVWEAGAIYENRILIPTSVIRYYRKLTGGK
ncbi:MAG: hypothetical protein NC094_05540 [Bacteroidales bacterium]|nr:hypothetical protein [Lachnoclostridium sp.]MCM1384200.1 hypothetical protein [Lachnoclostridium sp.]MCM1464866.1 hypothetical protein [Bacteroidales bacterium]